MRRRATAPISRPRHTPCSDVPCRGTPGLHALARPPAAHGLVRCRVAPPRTGAVSGAIWRRRSRAGTLGRPASMPQTLRRLVPGVA